MFTTFMGGYAYLLASKKNGTLYAGITNDLSRRMFEHKEGVNKGFTARYGVHTLVWYEEFSDILDAIAKEKRIKKWPRRWKLDLINKMNPEWDDLSSHFFLIVCVAALSVITRPLLLVITRPLLVVITRLDRVIQY